MRAEVHTGLCQSIGCCERYTRFAEPQATKPDIAGACEQAPAGTHLALAVPAADHQAKERSDPRRRHVQRGSHGRAAHAEPGGGRAPEERQLSACAHSGSDG